MKILLAKWAKMQAANVRWKKDSKEPENLAGAVF